jgi:o-succinylbenzoate synthase
MELCALVGDDEPAAMAREAAALAADGFRCFKLKVGRSELESDLARVAVVRTVIGADSALRLDANRAWSFAHAEAALAALASSRPEMIEEPLFDETELGRLAGPTRIALDESICNRGDLERAIARGGFQVLVVKLERVGGPLAALTLAEIAAAASIDVVFTDSIETAVGRAATAHVAAAAYRSSALRPHALGLGGLLLFDDAPRSPRPSFVVDGPGLGLDIEQTITGGLA